MNEHFTPGEGILPKVEDIEDSIKSNQEVTNSVNSLNQEIDSLKSKDIESVVESTKNNPEKEKNISVLIDKINEIINLIKKISSELKDNPELVALASGLTFISTAVLSNAAKLEGLPSTVSQIVVASTCLTTLVAFAYKALKEPKL